MRTNHLYESNIASLPGALLLQYLHVMLSLPWTFNLLGNVGRGKCAEKHSKAIQASDVYVIELFPHPVSPLERI